jgi:hypothetical protein
MMRVMARSMPAERVFGRPVKCLESGLGEVDLNMAGSLLTEV